MRYIRKRRQTLLERDPHCYWCGCEVFEAPGPKGPTKNNHATIDHLYSRADGPRPSNTRNTLVLACFKCNHERGKLQQIHPNKIEAWCLSNAFPQKVKKFRYIILFLYKLGFFHTKALRRNKTAADLVNLKKEIILLPE
jgi:hypothetical protein